MIDNKNLKALCEAAPTGPWLVENDSLYFRDDGYTRHLLDADAGHDVEDEAYYAALKFIAAANPAAVLELIAESQHLAELLECAQGDCRQAMQIMEKLTPQADLYQQVQIAAGSLPHGWEITLRIENGYGGVDLIDPYGTVVDLDNVDESLSESVASAVAFAMSKEASNG